MKLTLRIQSRKASQHGFSVLEFLVAMVILSIGMGGILPLLIGSITINKKAAGDTTSTMVAEAVLEQISSQAADDNNSPTITDCATPANTWTINLVASPVGGGSGGAFGGNGANLTNQATIDWTQDYNGIPAGYAAKYVACSTTNDVPVTYDVRWDVIQTSSSNNTKMLIISARPLIASPMALGYIAPVNLRTIVGM
jgi:prepilin-type N-terminal cleavage/methylation domain-containing protein